MTVLLLAIVVLLATLVLWLARPGPARRGGMLDHSAAAARGELDLDWSDPRGRPRVVSESERQRLIADFTRPFHQNR